MFFSSLSRDIIYLKLRNNVLGNVLDIAKKSHKNNEYSSKLTSHI